MKATFKVLFLARKEAMNKEGFMPIHVRITMAGQRSHFSTKIDVHHKMWDQKGEKAFGNSTEAKRINKLLVGIKANLTTRYQNAISFGEEITPEILRNSFLGLGSQSRTLLEFFGAFNTDREKLIGIDITQSTYNKYDLTCRRLEIYIKKKYRQNDIPLSRIDLDFVMGFNDYLRVNCLLSINSTEKLMHIFKRIMSLAVSNALIRVNPFIDHKIKKEKKRRICLTKDELQKVITINLSRNKKLDRVRDIFVFSCFTGLAYSEVLNLSTNDIQTSFDGDQWIMTERQKTGVPFNVKLLDVPKKIIEKYIGETRGNRVLPTISNQKTNDYIKEVIELCGIKKTVSFHLARHTFATTVALANGVSLESVSEMLGHTNLATTRIYAKMLNERVGREMDELSGSKEIQTLQESYATAQ